MPEWKEHEQPIKRPEETVLGLLHWYIPAAERVGEDAYSSEVEGSRTVGLLGSMRAT
jgi:hypothetical protein